MHIFFIDIVSTSECTREIHCVAACLCSQPHWIWPKPGAVEGNFDCSEGLPLSSADALFFVPTSFIHFAPSSFLCTVNCQYVSGTYIMGSLTHLCVVIICCKPGSVNLLAQLLVCTAFVQFIHICLFICSAEKEAVSLFWHCLPRLRNRRPRRGCLGCPPFCERRGWAICCPVLCQELRTLQYVSLILRYVFLSGNSSFWWVIIKSKFLLSAFKVIYACAELTFAADLRLLNRYILINNFLLW